MIIGLVSDTHVPGRLRALPAGLLSGLADVDLILHAGDLECLQVVRKLGVIADVQAVAGNCDPVEVLEKVPRKLIVEAAGKRIGLIHGNQPLTVEALYRWRGSDYDLPEIAVLFDYLCGQFDDVDVIVFGHLHAPVVRTWQGRLLVNPGAVVPNAYGSSYGLLIVDGDDIRAEIKRVSP